MSQNTTFKRSSVTKMLIAELVRTTHALPKGKDQYDAQTYLSPTGRTITKVMICGTAIEMEDVGKDSSLWRLRISDPSGTVQVYAGMYQPEAAAAIAQLNVPCFVAVIGKINIYKPEEGSHIVSIRPDSVTIIDGKNRDDFILDASLSLIRGVKNIIDEKMKETEAIYGAKEGKDTYLFVARQAIESLLPDHTGAVHYDHKAGEEKKDRQESNQSQKAPDSEPPKPGSKSMKSSPSSSSPQGKTDTFIDSSIKTVQEVIYEILKEKGTVKYDDLPDMLKARGINPLMVDWTSAVKRLMDEGQCFEPKIGILKITE